MTTHQPLVSVVIPCFNCERWIAQAIESALHQSYRNVEVIVVNDGSTDGSMDAIRRFGGRIRAIFKPNGGASSAMNCGMRAARGEWIQFLGADDVLHPDKLRLSIEVCQRDARIEFVWAPNLSVQEDFSVDAVRGYGDRQLEPVLSRGALDAAYAPSAAMLRASFLRRVGDFNESLSRWVDFEYHARIAAQLPLFVRLSEPLYFYRQHSGQRISDSNRNHTNIEQALKALTIARHIVEASDIPRPGCRSFLWASYLQLARSAAIRGDKKTFRHLLLDAAILRANPKFYVKCSLALLSSQLVGIKPTSVVIERVLQSARKKT